VCKVGERARTVSTRESGECELELEPDTGSCSKVKEGWEGRKRRILGRYGSWFAAVESCRMSVRSRMWQAREELEDDEVDEFLGEGGNHGWN